ncbi:SurA N-terminal domain-containing protein [Pelagibacterium sp. 26DY04]|uniref:SurA N-terminal domain-containing protein n=1 Tax=unclassified Pelagibacterium TaxID=2623280 RepID=UPI002815B483|nr:MULTISPECIES: SurA N-terminal domain-containing protein [unclassified Pelagibacterium]WMT88405.1 SurA N-terminal domain-containing protein [Pelagibacterium sp. 26DY04]WMT90917.1 SurA N-terminal domain-containing protein [Pelagibacterium sp. H642]
MREWLVLRTAGICLAVGLALMAFAVQAQSVRVTVNGSSITDQQINDRANLLRIEGQGSSNSNRIQLATEQLIDDQLRLNEAQRIGVTISDAQVDSAFANVATNMRSSASNLTNLLTQNGVNPETLRDRLRATLAWQQVVQQVLRSRVQISELELETQAAQQVTPALSFDYILKEVLFVIPEGSGVSASRRTAEANQYRSRYSGCDTAVDLAIQFTDAAVRDLGRRHATQLPEAVANELAGLTVGQISTPRVVAGGVSMLAICEKAQAEDLAFLTDDLRQEAGADELQAQAEEYLAQLRSQATIIRR